MKAKKRYEIDSSEAVCVDGQTYYLRIRSENTNNPVLLHLHGGPGSVDRGLILKHLSPLTSVCTLVLWDQPGAGKSYKKEELETTEWTVDMYVDATCKLIRYLKERFNKEKIFVQGHSFGTLLGVHTALRCPEDIAAYIGTGQVVNYHQEIKSYEFVLAEAKRRNDKKNLPILLEMGVPEGGNYRQQKYLWKQRSLLMKYGGIEYGTHTQLKYLLPKIRPMLSEYSAFEYLFKCQKANKYLVKVLSPQFGKIDLMDAAAKLEIPVYIFDGRYDYNCPAEVAKEWFDALEAPYKEWVWFEKSAHSPLYEESDLWNKIVAEKVFKVKL